MPCVLLDFWVEYIANGFLLHEVSAQNSKYSTKLSILMSIYKQAAKEFDIHVQFLLWLKKIYKASGFGIASKKKQA